MFSVAMVLNGSLVWRSPYCKGPVLFLVGEEEAVFSSPVLPHRGGGERGEDAFRAIRIFKLERAQSV